MKQWFKERKLDLITGGSYGLVTCLWLGWFGFLAAALIAYLWALAGEGYLGTNAWRREGVPLIIVLSSPSRSNLKECLWMFLACFLMVGVQYQGWSVPDVNQPEGSASPIGTFWWKQLGRPMGNDPLRIDVDQLTRGTWMLLLLLATAVLFIR